MSKTYWGLGLYSTLTCSWCCNTEDLFNCEGEAVCRDCLQSQEPDEDESLTLEERNESN